MLVLTRFNGRYFMRKKNKYNAKRVCALGKDFDSRRESGRYRTLLQLQSAGVISDLECQKPFVLIPSQFEISDETYQRGPRKGKRKNGRCLEKAVTYYADFYYKRNGVEVVEDVKGKRTADYIIKRKLMLYVHGIKIEEIRR